MARDAFISYSRADKKYAGRICEALTNANVSFWIDERDILPAGEGYGQQIVEGIEKSNWVVVLISQHAGSEQMEQEVVLAANHHRRIVPVRVQDVPMPKRLAYFLESKQRLDVFGAHFDAGVAKLIQTISSTGKADATVPVMIPVVPHERHRKYKVVWASVFLALVLAGLFFVWSSRVGREQRIAQLTTAGKEAFNRGDNAGAIDSFTRLLNLDTDNGAGLEGRARAYHAKHDDLRAMADLDLLVSKHPPISPEVHLLRADTLGARKNRQQAIEEYDLYLQSADGDQGAKVVARRKRDRLQRELEQFGVADAWLGRFEKAATNSGLEALTSRTQQLGALEKRLFDRCDETPERTTCYYHSAFEKAPAVTEYIVLKNRGDDSWQVNGYGYTL